MNTSQQAESLKKLIGYLDLALTRGAFDLNKVREIIQNIDKFEVVDTNKQDVFTKLIEHIDFAFKKGVFSLVDAQNIIELFVPFKQVHSQNTEEEIVVI